MTIHELKTVAPFYEAVQYEQKTFEVRRNDRDFKVGDQLWLREWVPASNEHTGRNVLRDVTYVLTHAEFPGVAEGYVVMGLRTLEYEYEVYVRGKLPFKLPSVDELVVHLTRIIGEELRPSAALYCPQSHQVFILEPEYTDAVGRAVLHIERKFTSQWRGSAPSIVVRAHQNRDGWHSSDYAPLTARLLRV